VRRTASEENGTRHDRPPTIVLVNLPWKPNRSMINLAVQGGVVL
jgi:hypothetical protein